MKALFLLLPTRSVLLSIGAGDRSGTRFDLLDITGDGPLPYARLAARYDFNERHALRLTLATPTRGRYEFNTCRLTYRWMFERSERWNLGLAPMCDRSIHLVDGYIVSDTKN